MPAYLKKELQVCFQVRACCLAVIIASLTLRLGLLLMCAFGGMNVGARGNGVIEVIAGTPAPHLNHRIIIQRQNYPTVALHVVSL